MKPIVLCILDGVGIKEEVYGNAVKQAYMPNFNQLFEKYPHSLLEASGKEVGLPNGQMGNSEVGHMNIGTGRVIYQPIEIINQKIQDKSFYENKVLKEIINYTKEKGTKLHLLGLLSDGGVHSHIDHLFALLDWCKKENLKNVYLHLFLDGRDTLPATALTYIHLLQDKIKNMKEVKIASIAGRYYAMDRDNRWERIQKEYDAITKGTYIISDIDMYIKESYGENINDEFIVPALVDPNGLIEANDGLICFNFRPDRLRELFMALTNSEFSSFERNYIPGLKLATMMPVSMDVISKPAFSLENVNHFLGQVISENHFKQLRIAETEKYAHVTYFFDGGREIPLKGEDRILVPSPKVATYDLKPEMSAGEITDKLVSCLDQELYDFVVLNYANGDMVGHTGNFKATIKALEYLDICIGRLFAKIKEKDGILILTSDHGNCDTMLDEDGNIVTAHSLCKVPFLMTKENIQLKNGKLGDIAPTILELMNISKPEEMKGSSLL